MTRGSSQSGALKLHEGASCAKNVWKHRRSGPDDEKCEKGENTWAGQPQIYWAANLEGDLLCVFYLLTPREGTSVH